MHSGREAAWLCQHCGYMADAYSCAHDKNATPRSGDLSVCLNCGARYLRELDRWRPLATAEYQALQPGEKRALAEMEVVRQRLEMPDLTQRGGRA
jgi:hypothetical protein